MTELMCPDCGVWVDRLDPSTGWCQSCATRWRSARRFDAPNGAAWVSCKYCWVRFRTDNKFVVAKKLSYATCSRCISEQRRRARLRKPLLVARVKCDECRGVFTPRRSGSTVTRYCDACRPVARQRAMVRAGRASGKVPRSRRSDGKFGAPDAPPIRVPQDPITGRFISGHAGEA